MDTRRLFSTVYRCQQLQQDSVRVIRSARTTIHMARHALARQDQACRTRDFPRVFLGDAHASPPPLPSGSPEQEQWYVEQEIILSEIAESRLRLACSESRGLPRVRCSGVLRAPRQQYGHNKAS